MTKTLAQTILECVAKLREMPNESPETGDLYLDFNDLYRIADDLEFAARNEPSGDAGELEPKHKGERDE